MKHDGFVCLHNAQLGEREQELSLVSSQLLQLQSDFQYNLQLLDSRDAELDQYDEKIAVATEQLQLKSCEVEAARAKAIEAQQGLSQTFLISGCLLFCML
jgi:hypothetical protein